MERTGSQHAMEAPQSFEQLLTLKEAAPLLGMHWKTLEILARRGEIPAVKLGKRWRFRVSALDRWLSTRLQPERVEDPASMDVKLREQPRRAS
jgi:excisionase family DNA binding protein